MELPRDEMESEIWVLEMRRGWWRAVRSHIWAALHRRLPAERGAIARPAVALPDVVDASPLRDSERAA